jgi:predicted acetylornithine/succinylornithine family transaminase
MSRNNRQTIRLTQRYVANTYTRYPIALVRGKGARVWDADGKEYLDFVAGIAVNSLGHGHPLVVRAIQRQAKQLIHVSNLYHIPEQAELARKLCRNSFADRVFFCNSGAEANEAAIKLARRFGSDRSTGKYEVLSMLNSFHGRTLATMTATGQEKIYKGYDPLPSGFRHIPYGDLKATEEAISEKTVAILVEPIQGEGGVVVPKEGYLQGLRKICNAKGLLLIFDEVQVGMGRTGKLFAYQHFGVEPDIMTLAKALGGGLPFGAMLAREDVARSFIPGSHASTFGGNPLACNAGLAVFQALLQEGVIKNCVKMGNLLFKGLQSLQARFPFIQEVRGKGLILGMVLEQEGSKIVEDCLEAGLLINCTANRVLRFLPPLTIGRKDIDRGLAILESVLARR